MAEPVVYPIAPARRRAMYFNLACYALVAVMAGGYWTADPGLFWFLFALLAFVLFGMTLRMLTSRRYVARIDGDEIFTLGAFGRPHAFKASEMTGAGLDPSRRIGVIAYRMEGADAEAYAPISFRMMGREGAEDFTARISELRPGLPPVQSTRNKT